MSRLACIALLTILATALVGLLSACGAGAESAAGAPGLPGHPGNPGPAGPPGSPAPAPAPTVAPAAPAQAPAAAAMTSKQVVKEAAVEKAVSQAVQVSSEADSTRAQLVTQRRIIIREVDMSLVVDDIQAAIDEIAEMAEDAGGWVVDSGRLVAAQRKYQHPSARRRAGRHDRRVEDYSPTRSMQRTPQAGTLPTSTWIWEGG